MIPIWAVRSSWPTPPTLAGHVTVADCATIGAFPPVHQFWQGGFDAFIGGFSVITRDALPFVKTVGDRNQGQDL